MTAIVRIYTNGGFIVAADGRQRELDGSVVSEVKQKIFSFGGDRFLAYSFTGHIGLGPANSPDTVFDFIEEFGRAAQVISASRYPTLVDYATRLARNVQNILAERCENAQIPLQESSIDDEESPTLADAMIDGYHSGSPSRVNVRFFRMDGAFADPEITTPDLRTGGVWFHGSNLIGNLLLKEKDPRLWNARSLRPLESALSGWSDEMLNAAITARAYIEGCSGPIGQELDPKICAGIGPNIHMASITEKDGFLWVPGFEPRVQS
jgi:hypothetical protein